MQSVQGLRKTPIDVQRNKSSLSASLSVLGKLVSQVQREGIEIECPYPLGGYIFSTNYLLYAPSPRGLRLSPPPSRLPLSLLDAHLLRRSVPTLMASMLLPFLAYLAVLPIQAPVHWRHGCIALCKAVRGSTHPPCFPSPSLSLSLPPLSPLRGAVEPVASVLRFE